ncbi:MAG TPA: hypothetical protein VF002_06590 [Gaiellaceae bacterium]
MRRIMLSSGIVVIIVAVSLAATALAQTTMSLPKLIGAVGKNNAFVITLKNSRGRLVKKLKAGRYTFVIHDYSAIHAFNLDGPHGFSHDFTKIPFIGMKTATLNLKAGKYKAYCPNHEATMFQFFTVTK